MVKEKTAAYILADNEIQLDLWLEHLQEEHFPNKDIRLIRNACLLAQLLSYDQVSESGVSCLQQGLYIAENVSELGVDQQTLSASVIYPAVEYAELRLEDVEEHLGTSVRKLVAGVQRMGAVDNLRQHHAHKRSQLDNVRKMLLAMVDDVRIVLIKLAERLQVLRGLDYQLPSVKQIIAREAMDIYAPLANRLGIGQFKWKMEDLAFRYIEPEQYKAIAKGLKSKRVARDEFVVHIVQILKVELKKNGIKSFEIYGRSKHIHSIYKKMQRKNVDISKIYDAIAVRVLVQTAEDCYAVLGLAHTLWQALTEEYDDYIGKPKPNGYRSLHTAVQDPFQRIFEIQIRTFDMHQKAEMGIAAHWLYKEGGQLKQASHERKIEWLRQILAWQKELASNQEYTALSEPDDLEDRVYVFTPKGEVIDLQVGATVLDFAYSIHSQVGHCCRGAKVNHVITPLNTVLKTGDHIEILTAKNGTPSRDWLNTNLGYLKTVRARAKVHHWFKQQDFDENVSFGREIFDREVIKLRLHNVEQEKIAKQLNYKTTEDFLAALGRGDLRRAQLISKLSPPKEKPIQGLEHFHETDKARTAQNSSDIYIHGVGNLLTHIARCCNPVPGEAIIGYITLTRGISIHKQTCNNISHASAEQLERLVDVTWGERPKDRYRTEIVVEAYDRTGLLHDITSLLSQEQISLLGLMTKTDEKTNIAKMQLSLEVFDLVSLSKIIDKFTLIKNVTQVHRIS